MQWSWTPTVKNETTTPLKKKYAGPNTNPNTNSNPTEPHQQTAAESSPSQPPAGRGQEPTKTANGQGVGRRPDERPSQTKPQSEMGKYTGPNTTTNPTEPHQYTDAEPSPTPRPSAGRGVPATMPTKTSNNHKDHRNSDRNNSDEQIKYLSANRTGIDPIHRPATPDDGPPTPTPPPTTRNNRLVPPLVRPARTKSSTIRTGLKGFQFSKWKSGAARATRPPPDPPHHLQHVGSVGPRNEVLRCCWARFWGFPFDVEGKPCPKFKRNITFARRTLNLAR